METTYPRDIFGQRMGTWDDHSSVNWVGWDVYFSYAAGQRLNMGGSSAYIDHADAVGTTTMVTDPSGLSYCKKNGSGKLDLSSCVSDMAFPALDNKQGYVHASEDTTVTVNGGEATHNDYMFALGVAARTARTEIKRAAKDMAINGALAGAGALIGAYIDATVATGETAGAETGLSAAKVGVNPDVEKILSGLKPSADDTELQGAIDQLYRDEDELPGGTAGALRYERSTGKLLSPAGHGIKAAERMRQLTRVLNSGRLSPHDAEVARTLIQNLSQALAGK